MRSCAALLSQWSEKDKNTIRKKSLIDFPVLIFINSDVLIAIKMEDYNLWFSEQPDRYMTRADSAAYEHRCFAIPE